MTTASVTDREKHWVTFKYTHDDSQRLLTVQDPAPAYLNAHYLFDTGRWEDSIVWCVGQHSKWRTSITFSWLALRIAPFELVICMPHWRQSSPMCLCNISDSFASFKQTHVVVLFGAGFLLEHCFEYNEFAYTEPCR